jgi:glycosyltransferase involved in cell wall biosynthesis
MDKLPIVETLTALSSGKSKPKLAIVSTYDELCGIASYTIALKKQLDPFFDITVFELDQFLLRHRNPRVRKMGDRHIVEICEKLRAFPVVNIQLEYGTFGAVNGDIQRRLKLVMDAAPSLSVTFHTVLAPTGSQWQDAWGNLKAGRLIRAFRDVANPYLPGLGVTTYRHLARLQRKKPVHIIVHTGRDARMMRYVQGFDHVHHHPLAFFTKDDVKTIKTSASRKSFSALNKLKPADVVIGLFGFVGPYKGFEVVLRALHWLPKNYHVAIFGGVHPQSIRHNEPINPYVKTLIKTAHAEEPDEEKPSQSKRQAKLSSLQVKSELKSLRDPFDLSDRIHFMGPLSDTDFAKGMAASDIVVMPYLEVGQSSSGPISMAVELGKRIVASRTVAYMQFEKYHPGRIEFFDIGNHIELAQRVQNLKDIHSLTPKFDAVSNAKMYGDTYQISQID